MRGAILALLVAFSDARGAAPTSPTIHLAACDATDPAQNWTLSPKGWGANNTIQNKAGVTIHKQATACLDWSQA